jgi:MFS transporter, DHA1 family, multidrug resistance protein
MTLPGRTEFIILIATIMMTVAFAIDSMLPALPAIGHSLHVMNENRWSLVITAFTIGFGIAQLFIGTLSDRFGRRKFMMISLVAYAVCSILAAIASSFVLLLAARALQGVGAAGARVLAVSVVRDRFEGRAMAQVMSLASAIFMAAPIIAPFMGTAVLAVAPWRWIFIVLAIIGVILFLWVALRLPETLAQEKRRQVTPAALVASARIVLGDRQSVAYTIANSCLMITVMGFLTSVQLIFAETFHRADLLPYGFGIMAGMMMVASFINSRIVMRLGMRRIGHSALVGMTIIAAFHAAFAAAGLETLISYIILQSLMMACFSFAAGNFGAMSMENMGSVAGTATSLQGSFTAIVGALGGAAIGQSFNGTTVPLYVGATVAGIIALTAIIFAEGRLFVPRHTLQEA